MKPKDVNEQLVGEVEDWDQNDSFSFTFYKVEVGGQLYDNVNVDYEQGVVDCYSVEDAATGRITKSYAIKATLEEITEQ